MIIGTRVHHRRYPFLVGQVMRTGETPNPYVIVKWEQHRYATPELVTDLRPTPAQP